MYAIKMNEDKSLTTTIQATIYQYEKNADTLVFLLPTTYENTNFADCSVLLKYILPNGIGRSEEIEMEPEPYKDYYKFRLKVSTRFTQVPGTIELWLSAIDIEDNVALKTGSINVEIAPSKNIVDYFDEEDTDQLNQLAAKVTDLERNKADSIIYDSDDNYIQLTANGVQIGDQIDVGEMVSNNDDSIHFGDEDSAGEDADDAPDDVIHF